VVYACFVVYDIVFWVVGMLIIISLFMRLVRVCCVFLGRFVLVIRMLMLSSGVMLVSLMMFYLVWLVIIIMCWVLVISVWLVFVLVRFGVVRLVCLLMLCIFRISVLMCRFCRVLIVMGLIRVLEGVWVFLVRMMVCLGVGWECSRFVVGGEFVIIVRFLMLMSWLVIW